jgi:hypothetical protein
MVNIVQLPSGNQYQINAAFGGDGPTSPLQLTSGRVVPNLGTREVRLVYRNIGKQSRLEQKLWTYQSCNEPEKDWNACYCFGEIEFFHDDFEVMKLTSWEAFEKGNIWVVNFLRGGEVEGLSLKDGELGNETGGAISIIGKVMFVNDVVKLSLGGKTRVIDSFRSKSERLRGLKKWSLIPVRLTIG